MAGTSRSCMSITHNTDSEARISTNSPQNNSAKASVNLVCGMPDTKHYYLRQDGTNTQAKNCGGSPASSKAGKSIVIIIGIQQIAGPYSSVSIVEIQNMVYGIPEQLPNPRMSGEKSGC